MNGRWIIYPETRFISEEKLRMALSDDIANGETDALPGDDNKLTLDEVCQFLSDTGQITFAAPNADVQLAQVSDTACYALFFSPDLCKA